MPEQLLFISVSPHTLPGKNSSHPSFLYVDNCMKINIFHTSEILLYYMYGFTFLKCSLSNQILDLHSLGNTGTICPAGSTGIGKFTCTLDKMKVIIISPVFDICLPNQIHGTDQLHSFKVCTVELLAS